MIELKTTGFGLLLVLAWQPCHAVENGCDTVFDGDYVSGWSDLDAVQLVDGPVFPGSQVNCRYFPEKSQKLNVLTRSESGFIEGVGYSLQYSDGSAAIQSDADTPLRNTVYADRWNLRCKSNATDRYACSLNRRDLVLNIDPDSGAAFVILGKNYRPGSKLLIRVDGNWAIKSDAEKGFSSEQSARILQQMKAGKQLVTHFHDDAHQRPTDVSMSLYGFPQAWLLAERVMQQLNRTQAGVQD